MKKILSKTAFSLLELIIASILVVVVILGIFAINSVLSNNNQDYGQRYLAKSETQATLNHILNDAALAVGSGTTVGTPPVLDQGILVGNSTLGAADNNSFCIHQQPNGVDSWVCYWLDTDSTSATYQEIQYCKKTYSLTPADADIYRGASAGSTNCNANTIKYLGTAHDISPSFDTTSGFSITIKNCLNNAIASCTDPTKLDPANNPQVQVTGSVFPSQEGM